MFSFIQNLSSSDWIALATMIITAGTAISSIVIAIATLKQNNQMIEESTRPYIVCYKDSIDINSATEYLVIENFGSSAGTITNMIYNKEQLKSLFKYTAIDLDLLNYFSKITLFPHQRYLFPINTNDVEPKNFIFEISYTSSNKTYHEKFDINLSQDYAVTFKKQNKSNPENEIFTISNAIQEFIRRK